MTGDYPSLSATDIKVMALTYQLEKEYVGIDHLRTKPLIQRSVNVFTNKSATPEMHTDVSGFYLPGNRTNTRTNSECTSVNSDHVDNDEQESEEKQVKEKEELSQKFQNLEVDSNEVKDEIHLMEGILTRIDLETEQNNIHKDDLENVDENVNLEDSNESYDDSDVDDDSGWITPANVKIAKKQLNSELVVEKTVKVACITTDFAMQNVLKQMNLNVAALDGRMIRQLRTFILRCYTCFKTTSIMTRSFCPKCGNQTLKRVSVTLNEEGKQEIHINGKKPLTARGKRFSLPAAQGGKHSHNPILVADQPMPDNKPSRLARTKNNPLDEDWIAGYSPFVMRDVTSKSALLAIRPGKEVKHWMRKNPNEARRKKK